MAVPRALVIRSRSEDVFAGAGGHRRRGRDLRPEHVHYILAVRFLLITYLHLVDGGLEAEHFRGISQRGAPLPRSCLRGDIADTLLLAVISLRNRRVELVRTHRADALVLEINMRGSSQGFLQGIGADKGRAAVEFVHLAHRPGNLNPRVGLIEFLAAELAGENGKQVFGPERLVRLRIERRQRFGGHLGLDIVPMAGNVVFGKEIALVLFLFFSFFHRVRMVIFKVNVAKSEDARRDARLVHPLSVRALQLDARTVRPYVPRFCNSVRQK